MTLIKTSLLNSIAVFMRLLTFLGINKLLAIYVGPAGYAILGQYQNAITMITTFASGATNTGVTKYTAEYFKDEAKQRLLWQTAGTIALTGSLLSSLIIALFSKQLAILFLNDSSYASIFIWFALSLVFFVLNALLLAILNGKKEIATYVLANIAGSILAFLVTSILVVQYGLYGALLGLAIYQSLTFFVTFFLCSRLEWFRWHNLFGKIDPFFSKKLVQYTIMAIVSALCVPLSQMLIRYYIAERISWESAGYVEAIWRFSSAYLMLVTTTLSVYYLPKLSELDDTQQIKKEIIHAYKLVLPTIILGAFLIYFFRQLIISLLFAKNFQVMEELFAWQLIGDTIKIASWLIAYLYLAKGFFHLYVFSELFFSISFFVLVFFLEPHFHLEAVVIAHALNYSFHFIFVFYTLKLKGVL